jgi:hypothetical protein
MMLFVLEAEISSKEKAGKIILKLKVRLHDLEDKLKKSENRSWDNLRTGKRLNLGSSRRIIEDVDNHFDTSEHGNEEQAHDLDSLFPPYRPSNPDSPSRREESTPKQKEQKIFVYHMRGFPKLDPLYANLCILISTSLLNFYPRRAIIKEWSHLHHLR